MEAVQSQYEAYPYPARDPADEARRLIIGSPSHPVEIDHFLFGGVRDWRRPMRVLVAGGGTGDALVMLAQLLQDRKVPAEIHYLDLSTASRKIAEARIAARNLTSVRFHTADLTTAPELGPFDYIDCCGVLHHLPDPDIGFKALADALAPEGGLGGMVYAPFGRSGVYPLQHAFGDLFAEADAPDKVAAARETLGQLAQSHPFARNMLVRDHEDGDAGLYDLLLHAQDRPYTAEELISALERAGLALSGFLEPQRYDPTLYLGPNGQKAAAPALSRMTFAQKAGLAERLAGNMKTHVFYASRAENGAVPSPKLAPERVPVLHRIKPEALAASVAKTGALRFVVDGFTVEKVIDRRISRLLGSIDGRSDLAALQRRAGLDWFAFSQAAGPAFRALEGFNALRYSRFAAV